MKKEGMKAKMALVIAAIMVISAFSAFLVLASTNQINAQNVTISEIKNNPDKFIGKEVVVKGVYMGWNSSEPPPVTRSDWVLDDGTGRIYITGKLPGFYPPEGIGKNITVTGIVRNKGEQIYIEALELDIGTDMAINTRVNETFTIELEQALNPNYEWKCTEYDRECVELVDEGFKAPSDPELMGITLKYFTFKALKKGTSELEFAYGSVDAEGGLTGIIKEESYTVRIDSNLIINGDFSDGLKNWTVGIF